MEWTEIELITLNQIEAAADRVEVLKALLDAETAKDPVSTRRVSEVAAEVRQLEVNIVKWSQQLVPDPSVSAPKSVQHQRAALTRWRGHNGTLKHRVVNDADLREHLLDDARYRYDLMVRPMRLGNDGKPKIDADGEPIRRYHPELEEALTPRVDGIAAGDEIRLHRWQLPDDHPERRVGHLSDNLVLGRDDVLRLAE